MLPPDQEQLATQLAQAQDKARIYKLALFGCRRENELLRGGGPRPSDGNDDSDSEDSAWEANLE